MSVTPYSSNFKELNDCIIYVHGTSEATFSVTVNNLICEKVVCTIDANQHLLELSLNDRGVTWDTRKDVNSAIAHNAVNCPYI